MKTRLLSLLALAALSVPALVSAQGGNVLPPTAKPKGVALADLVVSVASFNMTNDLDFGYYPNTPIQILYWPNPPDVYVIKSGTFCFVPVWWCDDSEPVLVWPGQEYPKTRDEAIFNMFDPTQLNAHDLSITVDGKEHPIGPEHLVGPFESATPMPWGSTHVYMVCAFIGSLGKGDHTVTLKAKADGPLLTFWYGWTMDAVIDWQIKVK